MFDQNVEEEVYFTLFLTWRCENITYDYIHITEIPFKPVYINAFKVSFGKFNKPQFLFFYRIPSPL